MIGGHGRNDSICNARISPGLGGNCGQLYLLQPFINEQHYERALETLQALLDIVGEDETHLLL